ncbi:hypothetical protein FJU30_06625 [Affinibrenneria salicis]|uniref:Uncharacterized protein n=1 Tax=Affinibrenneria salicis TaxID=2590031 RepID=A0A5J5G4G6_9GAMM|nr:hypothetical protein [Affinibrenneria salicis]KAA9001947.1 hypothetical protein FJU30_06625 [Affinibrenneria salicis]
MNTIDTLLPSGPIKILRPAIAHRWQSLLAGIVLIIGSIGLLYWVAPSLARDYLISQTPQVMDNAQIDNGRCITKYILFTDCSADIAYNYQGQHYEGSINLMFIDFSLGDYSADVVISARQPELATLSLGIDKLYNRILLSGALVLLLLVVGLYSLYSSFILGRAIGQAKKPTVLKAIAVEIGTPRREWGQTIVEYTYRPTDKKARKLFSTLAKNELPFLLDAENDRALAVLPAGSNIPVLLDQGLTRLDLTDQQRQQILSQATARA